MEKLSLIIPSSGREDNLQQVLDALSSSSASIREIVVSWDGNTCPAVEAQFPSCRYVGPLEWRGPAAARNAGAAAVSGDWLLFLDDDVVPCTGAIAEIDRLIRENPEVGAWVFDVAAHPSVERNIYVRWAYRNRAHSVYPENPEPVSPDRFCSSFVAVRRRVFEELEGFSEDLRLFEDVEFAFRLQKAGIFLYSCGSVKGLHLKQMDRRWFVDRCNKLGPGLLSLHSCSSPTVSGRVAFMLRHPRLCIIAGLLCSGWQRALPVVERVPGPPGIALLDLVALAGMADSLSTAVSQRGRKLGR